MFSLSLYPLDLSPTLTNDTSTQTRTHARTHTHTHTHTHTKHTISPPPINVRDARMHTNSTTQSKTHKQQQKPLPVPLETYLIFSLSDLELPVQLKLLRYLHQTVHLFLLLTISNGLCAAAINAPTGDYDHHRVKILNQPTFVATGNYSGSVNYQYTEPPRASKIQEERRTRLRSTRRCLLHTPTPFELRAQFQLVDTNSHVYMALLFETVAGLTCWAFLLILD